MGRGLGRLIATTRVTALPAGPALPYPLASGNEGDTNASSDGEDSDAGAIAGGAIGCIVAVILIATFVTIISEKKYVAVAVALCASLRDCWLLHSPCPSFCHALTNSA